MKPRHEVITTILWKYFLSLCAATVLAVACLGCCDSSGQQASEKDAELVSWIALGLFLLAGGLATVGLGLVTTQRMRVRAMEAEMEARKQAERARQAEMEARKQAERAKVNKEVEGLPNDKPGKNTGGVRQP